MKTKALFLGLVVILASNAVLLIRVARNRSGGPIQTIELTERELPLMPRGEEDSSVSLRVAWRPYFFRWPDNNRIDENMEGKFDNEKLQTLGFDCGTADEKSPYFRVPLRRLLYVALEYRENLPEEPAGQASPTQPGARQRSAAEMNPAQSRLIVVDAGRSFEQLRLKYPDPRTHLIVRGLIMASTVHDPRSASDPYWLGRVTAVLPPEIHVPLPYSTEFNRMAAEDRRLSRYSVTLHYGRNMEPWIGSITLKPR
jgi:hypothetical protein